MRFDPAVEAQTAWQQSRQNGELGGDLTGASEAEAVFSSEMGEAAVQAYRDLVEIGSRHPDAHFFQEFLIYLTWQQVMADPVPGYFRKGAELCEAYLARHGAGVEEKRRERVREIFASFRNGLGQKKDLAVSFEEDTIKDEG